MASAWAAGLRGFMTQVVVEEGSTVTWTGTFAWVVAPGVGTGLRLGLSAYFVKVGGSHRARWLVNRRAWKTREELRIAIVAWIEKTYHRRRREAALGRLTPVDTS